MTRYDWILAAIMVATFGNGYYVAWVDGRDTLQAYKQTPITFTLPGQSECQTTYTLEEIHQRFSPDGERAFTDEAHRVFQYHLAWTYLCGANADDSKHRGVQRFCKDKDRCA